MFEQLGVAIKINKNENDYAINQLFYGGTAICGLDSGIFGECIHIWTIKPGDEYKQ